MPPSAAKIRANRRARAPLFVGPSVAPSRFAWASSWRPQSARQLMRRRPSPLPPPPSGLVAAGDLAGACLAPTNQWRPARDKIARRGRVAPQATRASSRKLIPRLELAELAEPAGEPESAASRPARRSQ